MQVCRVTAGQRNSDAAFESCMPNIKRYAFESCMQKQYKEMVAKVNGLQDIFGRWLKLTSSPIELLVLGAL